MRVAIADKTLSRTHCVLQLRGDNLFPGLAGGRCHVSQFVGNRQRGFQAVVLPW